jgi:hypothetical protein
VACTWTNRNHVGSAVPWTNPSRIPNPTREESRSQLNPEIRKASGRQVSRTMESSFWQDTESDVEMREF